MRRWARGPRGPARRRQYRVLATGERLEREARAPDPPASTTSRWSTSRTRALPLRGKLDTLQGLLLDAQCAADADGARGLVGELGEALELARALVGAEVTGRAARRRGSWAA